MEFVGDEEAVIGTESSPSQCTGHEQTQQQDPLVAVTFQKNPNRKQKFLEAEPKALGVPIPTILPTAFTMLTRGSFIILNQMYFFCPFARSLRLG